MAETPRIEEGGAKGATWATRKGIATLGALWGLVIAGAALAPGCYGRNCEGEVTEYGLGPSEGRMLDETTWESSPLDGQWLPFPQQRIWIFDIAAIGDRSPEAVIPYVSAQQNPIAEGGNFTIAAGNLAEVSAATRGRVVVKNGTCADYFLRVWVKAAPPLPGGEALPSGEATNDAGSTADAGDADAAP